MNRMGNLNTIDELLEDIRRGRMVIVMDDEDRENEGDLVMAAELVRPEDVNFMARYGRGLICLTLTRDRCRQLRLPLMVSETDLDRRTNFTVSIEAAEGVTTGISAYDRAHTIRTAVRPDARPEHLVQFGHMGSVFAEEILAIPKPTVALLSIGEEPEKGNRLVRETHPLLERSRLDFVGNVESRELLAHAADVVVCDGFTGNMALKLMEGTIKTLLDEFRKEIEESARGKLGGLLIRPAARGLRRRLDPDTYGGAYLLGLRGLVVIAHGSSSRTAIANAITLGAQGAAGKVVERVAARLEEEVAAAPG